MYKLTKQWPQSDDGLFVNPETNPEYLQWLSEGNTPEPADIPPAPTYQQLRAAEYNLKSTGEQFGMMFDDQINGTTTWIDWQDGIKLAIPK